MDRIAVRSLCHIFYLNSGIFIFSGDTS